MDGRVSQQNMTLLLVHHCSFLGPLLIATMSQRESGHIPSVDSPNPTVLVIPPVDIPFPPLGYFVHPTCGHGEEPGCPHAPFPLAALSNEPLQNLPRNRTPNVNLFQDTADTSNTVYPTDEQEEITVLGLDDDKVVRQAFIFKVFLVLTMQLFITLMVVALFTFQEKLKTFVRENCWPWYVSFITFLLVFIRFGCSEGFRHKHPWNLVPMLLLTLSMSYMTESIASCFNANVIIMATAITVVLCFTMVTFSLRCKCDFTSCASVLLECATFISIFGIVCNFISNDILLTMYNLLGMLLFSCFLAMVTQLFLGNMKLSLSPKEHMFGALSGYLIIIVIFFHSLHIAKSGLLF